MGWGVELFDFSSKNKQEKVVNKEKIKDRLWSYGLNYAILFSSILAIIAVSFSLIELMYIFIAQVLAFIISKIFLQIGKMNISVHFLLLSILISLLFIPIAFGNIYAIMLISPTIIIFSFIFFDRNSIKILYSIGAILFFISYFCFTTTINKTPPINVLVLEIIIGIGYLLFNALLINIFSKNLIATQKRLSKNLHFQRNLIELSPEIIYTLDAAGKYNMVNKKFELVSKLDRVDILGKHKDEIFGRDKDTKQGIYEDKKILNEKADSFQGRMKLRDNNDFEVMWVSYNKTPIKEGNRVTGVLCIMSDITLLVESNQMIEKQNNKLEVQNQELLKYIKSNSELESFAYVASHDLKTPMRTVISYSQLLKRSLSSRLNEVELEYFKFIEDGTKSMNLLIDDLLKYSLVNRADFEPSEVNVFEVIETVVHSLTPVIKELKAKLFFEKLRSIKIEADRSLLKQLFQNLIVNALKFRHQERVPEIMINYVEKDSEYLFSVKDNGIGIEAEFRDLIFKIFKRLHNVKDYEGTGIGLAICEKVVHKHRGRIWIESTPGKGSTFFFTILKDIK